uniref:Methylcrotonoyl-CoA carboxylase subunit alpha, mitochondrial n=1 Tax=Rhabditophanes sp. KR3021 TaxID=114890 RepID=A0AC35TH11_9BILA
MLRASNNLFQQWRTQTTSNIKRIDKILIANRGEIAMRIIGTAKKMGVETVAVYSDADNKSLHMKHADYAYNIGAPPALESYLNMDKLIDVALKTNSKAVHPGYGFLSENPDFAKKCIDAGLIFIGPSPQAIYDMGAKNVAKDIMKKAGVPVIEGYHGGNQDPDFLFNQAKSIGFPVMLKAVCGGGGKGMRIAANEKEFFEKLETAKSEAFKSFGDKSMLIEKYIVKPRHVEVQIFGDHYGNYVHLWERDCSIQRRHQKIIEEAPAPNLELAFREKLGKLATKAAEAANYVGAGTVEFIIDPSNDFYFLEMNTRLQVEHPVTEAITGVDLVEWQIRVAQGEKIPLKQEEIKFNGHSFETRVYAEDTQEGFMPLAGDLRYLSFPKDGPRIDTGVYEGSYVSVYYDPMIAKITVHGADRNEALAKMEKALSNTHIGGLKTNIDFVKNVVRHEQFIQGNVYTDFIGDNEKVLFSEPEKTKENYLEAAIGSILLSQVPKLSSPFSQADWFRMNHSVKKSINLKDKKIDIELVGKDQLNVTFDGKVHSVNLKEVKLSQNDQYKAIEFVAEVDGAKLTSKVVLMDDCLMTYGGDSKEHKYPFAKAINDEELSGAVDGAKAPMPGIIDKVLVKPGDSITAGQSLIVMVAMKMEYVIKAPHDGIVESISCIAGQNVPKNAILIKFKDDGAH